MTAAEPEPAFQGSGNLEDDLAALALAVLKMTESMETLTGICQGLYARIVTLEHANGYATVPQPTETEPPPIPPRPYDPDRMP